MRSRRLLNNRLSFCVFTRGVSLGAQTCAGETQDKAGGHAISAYGYQRVSRRGGQDKIGDLQGDIKNNAQQQTSA